jgi:FAD:protein FMN transferase
VTTLQAAAEVEALERFSCFGGNCAVSVAGFGPAGTPDEAVQRVRRRMLAWHDQFSRFEPDSELSALNRDPRETVPVSAMMAKFVEVAAGAAALTDGLVDPTLVSEIEAAGYVRHSESPGAPLAAALASAPPRAPGRPNPREDWRRVRVDRPAGTVTRPPGLRLDSGGIAKGLFADVLAMLLGMHASFAVNASGDVRFGGASRRPQRIQVASPFDDSILHVFEPVSGAAATSGIGKRSWLDANGRPAHHLLDPATGRPAFTGVVQATALAPTAIEAEALSKAAVLSGPEGASGWLRHGGVVVLEDGRLQVISAG